MNFEQMILFFAILIVVSMVTSKISSRYGLPLLIVFILVGVIAGKDVLNLFYLDDAIAAKSIADALLIFIIFDGGFRVDRKDFLSVAGPALTLATFGVAVTALVLGYLIYVLFGMPFLSAMMVASIISSTDAAAVFMITKENPIKRKLATTLAVESAANDPMAILLTITFIEILLNTGGNALNAVLLLVWRFAGGILVGFLIYKATVYIFGRLNFDNRGNYSVLMLGIILLAYGLAALIGGNGIIAVFFMGYWLGTSEYPAKKGVSNFLESVSTMSNMGLFIILGLLSSPAKFADIWVEGLVISAILIFLARPVAIFLSTMFFKFNFKEKAFLVWGGIKGAVPIVLATYPASAGLDPDGKIFNLIFFAVFLSCVLQGTTLGPLSRLMKFTEVKRPQSPYSVELHTTTKSDIDMFELHVDEDAPVVGLKLSELDVDKSMLITSIIREEKIVFPKGNVVLRSNDIVYVLAHSGKIDEINARMNNYPLLPSEEEEEEENIQDPPAQP